MQVAVAPGMLQSLAAPLGGPPAPRPAGAAQPAPPRTPSALDLRGAPGSAPQPAFRRVGGQRAGDGQDATPVQAPATVCECSSSERTHHAGSAWWSELLGIPGCIVRTCLEADMVAGSSSTSDMVCGRQTIEHVRYVAKCTCSVAAMVAGRSRERMVRDSTCRQPTAAPARSRSSSMRHSRCRCRSRRISRSDLAGNVTLGNNHMQSFACLVKGAHDSTCSHPSTALMQPLQLHAPFPLPT